MRVRLTTVALELIITSCGVHAPLRVRRHLHALPVRSIRVGERLRLGVMGCGASSRAGTAGDAQLGESVTPAPTSDGALARGIESLEADHAEDDRDHDEHGGEDRRLRGNTKAKRGSACGRFPASPTPIDGQQIRSRCMNTPSPTWAPLAPFCRPSALPVLAVASETHQQKRKQTAWRDQDRTLCAALHAPVFCPDPIVILRRSDIDRARAAGTARRRITAGTAAAAAAGGIVCACERDREECEEESGGELSQSSGPPRTAWMPIGGGASAEGMRHRVSSERGMAEPAGRRGREGGSGAMQTQRGRGEDAVGGKADAATAAPIEWKRFSLAGESVHWNGCSGRYRDDASR